MIKLIMRDNKRHFAESLESDGLGFYTLIGGHTLQENSDGELELAPLEPVCSKWTKKVFIKDVEFIDKYELPKRTEEMAVEDAEESRVKIVLVFGLSNGEVHSGYKNEVEYTMNETILHNPLIEYEGRDGLIFESRPNTGSITFNTKDRVSVMELFEI